jgi:hypothetical protein
VFWGLWAVGAGLWGLEEVERRNTIQGRVTHFFQIGPITFRTSAAISLM